MAKPPKKKYVSKTQGTRLDDGTYVTPIAEVKGYKTPANAVREGRGKFAKGLYSGANLATEVMGTPLALALETLSGRGDYKSALPNVDRSNKMFGLPYDKNNLPQNEQLSPSKALGIDNPYMSVPIDLATDLLTGKLATSGKSIGKNLIKNKIPKQLQSVNQAGFANLFGLGKPKQSFKSEIDWGKWNKEIPENKALMQEYNTIEQQAKANGTWMKNPDGSAFQGTPEQFVQQNSKNFKKAFPEGFDNTYRGDRGHYHILNSELNNSKTFTGNKNMALNYTYENAKPFTVNSPLGVNPNRGKDIMSSEGLYELYGKKSNNSKILNSKRNADYSDIDIYDEDILNYFKNKELGNKSLKSYYNKNMRPISTDDLAYDYLKNKDLDNITINNIYDSSFEPGTVRINNNKPGNYLKSMWGNNGMFDMTNPNIYKGLIPGAVATGIGTQMLQNNKDIKALGGKITNMKKKKFKLGGITDPPKTYSWSSGKKPGKTAQIQNTQNSSISKTTPSIIKNTTYEGKLLPEAEVVASKIVKNPIDIFTNPIDTFTNPYRNQPLGNQPFPFTYTDDTMIDDGYGYGHNNMWMSKTLDIDGYKKSNKTDGTSVTGHINDIMENYDELKTINPTLYLIKKNLSLPNEKQYSGKYADDALGDYFNNEKNYINKNIIPKGYTYRSINDDNSLIQSFTPNKDTLLGNITLTPEMWKDIYNSKSDKEAKQKLFKMANVSKEEQKNFDNTFIHMNLNDPKKLSQYKKIKSKLENTNWDASTDKPTSYIKYNNGGRIGPDNPYVETNDYVLPEVTITAPKKKEKYNSSLNPFDLTGIVKNNNRNKEKDSVVENIMELIDPTGRLSHDDAQRAYNEYKQSKRILPNFDQALDMFSAVPALGRFGKFRYIANLDDLQRTGSNVINLVKPIYKLFPWQDALNTIGTSSDVLEDNVSTKKSKPKSKYGSKVDKLYKK